MEEAFAIEARMGVASRRDPALAPSPSEAELIDAAREGSAKAIASLVRRHWPMVHRSVYMIVQDEAAAEDVAQESILAALAALDRFDTARPITPWLNRITVNNALKWTRSAARRREVSAEVAGLDGEAAEARGPEVSDELLAALARLELSQRAVVVLRYLLDCTPGEIANSLCVPRGTVNSRLRRALDRLGEELREARE